MTSTQIQRDERDGELIRLKQVIDLCKEFLGCIELSDEYEWARIRKYVYDRFKIDLPINKPDKV